MGVRGRGLDAVVGSALRFEPQLTRATTQARRAAFIARVKAAARWHGAQIELSVAEDVAIGNGVRVSLQPGSRNVLRIAAGSRLGDRVLIMLKGGEIHLGPYSDIRRDVVLNVAGRFEVIGNTPISWGSVVHCANAVTLHETCGLAERVTIADSSHFFTEPGANFYHNVKVGKVDVGANTWICPGAVLTRTASVGDHCIVAANSVVLGVVPPGHLASGVPATYRPLDLPWTRE